MILPIRCFSCHKVLSDKWEYYLRESEKLKKEDSKAKEEGPLHNKHFDGNFTKKILDDLGLHKQCCRRHFLGHVDLIETI